MFASNYLFKLTFLDIVDSSGLRFVYTPQLRQHDAGIMSVGHQVSAFEHIIPPNAKTFLDYSECSAQCLTAVSVFLTMMSTFMPIKLAGLLCQENFFVLRLET